MLLARESLQTIGLDVKQAVMDGASLAKFHDLDDALGIAQKINVESYLLGEQIEADLITAAQHGAAVRVVLSGRCFGPNAAALAHANAAGVARMQAGGVQAALSAEPIHRKAVLVDKTMYLDSRNFCGADDLLVRTNASREIARAEHAFNALWARATRQDQAQSTAHAPLDAGSLSSPSRKDAVLAEEMRSLTDGPVGPIDLATESLGPCALTAFLETAAATRPVRVVAGQHAYASSAPMRAEIAELRAAGVDVRLSRDADKFALSAGRAWVGSANASAAVPAMSEWGTVLTAAADQQLLAERFADSWAHSRAVAK